MPCLVKAAKFAVDDSVSLEIQLARLVRSVYSRSAEAVAKFMFSSHIVI